LQREPIDDWELGKAKNTSRRSSIQALQSSLGIAIRLTHYAIYFNDPNLTTTKFEKIAAVTKQDVQRVAKKYLDLNQLQIIAVGDASKIADVLRQYGTVEIYDTEGKPVRSPAGEK
jgi:zinc protease